MKPRDTRFRASKAAQQREQASVAAGADPECLAAFGPWVRADDGTWVRKRPAKPRRTTTKP